MPGVHNKINADRRKSSPAGYFERYTKKKMKHRHWQYFLSIEKDILKISDYVELHSENYKVFSTELTKTYLTICSEIDVVLKLLAEKCDETIWDEINKKSEKLHPDMELYKLFLKENYLIFLKLK